MGQVLGIISSVIGMFGGGGGRDSSPAPVPEDTMIEGASLRFDDMTWDGAAQSVGSWAGLADTNFVAEDLMVSAAEEFNSFINGDKYAVTDNNFATDAFGFQENSAFSDAMGGSAIDNELGIDMNKGFGEIDGALASDNKMDYMSANANGGADVPTLNDPMSSSDIMQGAFDQMNAQPQAGGASSFLANIAGSNAPQGPQSTLTDSPKVGFGATTSNAVNSAMNPQQSAFQLDLPGQDIAPQQSGGYRNLSTGQSNNRFLNNPYQRQQTGGFDAGSMLKTIGGMMAQQAQLKAQERIAQMKIDAEREAEERKRKYTGGVNLRGNTPYVAGRQAVGTVTPGPSVPYTPTATRI